MWSPRDAAFGNIRTLLGYCLIGFANTILPVIVFAGAYLIVPFPRPVVILIQTIPAVAAKLLLPYLSFRVSHWVRPIAFAVGWAISVFVIYVSPPNVTPVLRILAVALASVSAAAGEVSWLGLMRFYGRAGLVGWGVGTGAGLLICSVLPYGLTFHMQLPLRSALGYAWYLVPLMLVSHYLVLPRLPTYSPLDTSDAGKGPGDDVDLDIIETAIPNRPRNQSMDTSQPLPPAESNMILARQLAKPFMLPLFLAAALYAITFPGFSRSLPVVDGFDTYSSYVAAYGFAFQLGNFVARSLPLFTGQLKSLCSVTIAFAVMCLVLANAITLFMTSNIVVFSMVFVVGFGVGGIYMETFGTALSQKHDETGPEKEFSLGIMGVGEPVGLIAGGLVGCVLEALLCGHGSSGDRWCFTTR